MTTIFGWIAGSISVSCAIPQIYYTYKLKSVSSISLYSLLFKTISGILYIIHGYNIGDTAGYCMTSVSTAQIVILLLQYYIYRDLTHTKNCTVLPLVKSDIVVILDDQEIIL